MKREEIFGQAVTVKIKSHDFYTKTKVSLRSVQNKNKRFLLNCKIFRLDSLQRRQMRRI